MGAITLPNFRTTADVRMNTKLKDGGVYIEWSSLTEVKAWIWSDAQKALAGRVEVSVDTGDATVLKCLYASTKPQYPGVNRLIVQGRYNGSLKTYDKPVFNFVPRTAEATGSITISDPEVDVEIEVTDTTSSILDNTIAAALAAAAHAEHAASLVPLQVLQDCEAATAVALTAASKAPVIGENGHWWVWNSKQAAYVDTGKQAKGDTGNGIASFSVVESQEDDADNVVTVTFTDGTTETFNVKNGKTGNGIASIVQTVESPDDAGTNVITVTMTNGTVITFNVKNGSKGQPGAAQAAYKSVETLPTASAATMDKIYLTPSGTAGVYNMSYTDYDGSAYSWVDMGTTAIQLSDYATKAEVSQLEAEMGNNVTYQETPVTPSWVYGIVKKTDGSITESTDYKYTTVQLNGAKVVRFLGNAYNDPTQWNDGFAFYDNNGNCINSFGFGKSTTGANHTEEYIVPAPEGAVAFKTTVYDGPNASDTVVRPTDFYCYLESGDTVSDLVENAEIFDINYTNIDESSDYYQNSLVGVATDVRTLKFYTSQYSGDYKIWIFKVPAGKYRIKRNNSAPGTLITVGTVSSIADFVNNGNIKSAVLFGATGGVGMIYEFDVETLIFITGRTDVPPSQSLNFYASIGRGVVTTIKEVVETLDDNVENIIEQMDGENLEERTEALEAEVFETRYINLDITSPYYDSSLSNAYVAGGTHKITTNQYTGGYKIWLFRLPSGKYKATRKDSYRSGVGVVVGTLTSDEDLVAGTTVASVILDSNSESEVMFDLESETFLFIVGRTDVPPLQSLNFYASCEEAEEVWVISDLKNEVSDLKNEVENMFKIDLDIVIPDTVYAIVGTELNIWNDAVSLSIDRGLLSPLNYQIRWSCSKGMITDRGFRFTPVVGDVGNLSCICYIYDMRGVLLASKTFTIKVLAKNALSTSKNIVYFGDSLGPDAATKLYDNFHDTSRFSGTIPKMLGTKGSTKNYEAVGGYRWSSYATAGSEGYRISVSGVTSMQVGAVYSDGSHNFEVYEVNITEGVGNCLLGRHYTSPGTLIMPSGTLTKVSGGGDASVPYTDAFQESVNPLWNDTTQKLDINQYKQMLVDLGQLSSVSDKIDAVSFQFGINDNALANDLPTLRGYISDLYNLFVGDNANCKFIVGLTTSSGNDVNGSGANYGATYDWKTYLKNTYIIRKFYLSLQTDFPNMRIATPNLYLDRYYGYALGTRQVSNRCTETEKYHTNYVHPGASGYEQMADAYLACYVGVLTES